MADKKTPSPDFVSLVLKEGPTHELRLVKVFNRICDAEEVSGCNLFRALAGGGNVSSREVRALLFACLLEWNPKVTLEECGDLLGGSELDTVLNALGRALGVAEEEPEQDIEAEPVSINEVPVAPVA